MKMAVTAWEKQRWSDNVRGDPLFWEAVIRMVEPELKKLKAETAAAQKKKAVQDAKEAAARHKEWLKHRIAQVKGEAERIIPEKQKELAELEAELKAMK